MVVCLDSRCFSPRIATTRRSVSEEEGHKGIPYSTGKGGFPTLQLREDILVKLELPSPAGIILVNIHVREDPLVFWVQPDPVKGLEAVLVFDLVRHQVCAVELVLLFLHALVA